MNNFNPFKLKQSRTAAVLAVGLLLLAFFIFLRSCEYGTGLPCMIYTLTGLYCPGCGSGRAMVALSKGNLSAAIGYNIAAVILLPFLVAYFVIKAIEFILGKNIIDKKIPHSLLYGILALLFIYGILRNIPLDIFNILRP